MRALIDMLGERDRARTVAVRLEAQLAQTVDALIAIRALHGPVDRDCLHCVECVFPHPCSTRQLVDEALTQIGWDTP